MVIPTEKIRCATCSTMPLQPSTDSVYASQGNTSLLGSTFAMTHWAPQTEEGPRFYKTTARQFLGPAPRTKLVRGSVTTGTLLCRRRPSLPPTSVSAFRPQGHGVGACIISALRWALPHHRRVGPRRCA